MSSCWQPSRKVKRVARAGELYFSSLVFLYSTPEHNQAHLLAGAKRRS